MNSLTKVTIALALCAICSAVPIQISSILEENEGLYQGDIIGINPNQDDERRRGISINSATLWTNGVVYWKYNNESDYTTYEKSKWEAGMKLVADATRIGTTDCISFRNVSSDYEGNYVNIHNGGGCSSALGMAGYGAQRMTLASACGIGNTAHEFIHALGFDHEQNRPDRDQFVNVLFGNVKDGYARAYYKRQTHETNTLGFNYDFDSIMHYNDAGFSKNRYTLKTMTPVNPLPSGVRMGQRDHLSETDVKEIQKKYGCTGTQSAPTTKSPVPVVSNGRRRIESAISHTHINVVGSAIEMNSNKGLASGIFYQSKVRTSAEGYPQVVFHNQEVNAFLSYNAGKVVSRSIVPNAAGGFSVSFNEVFTLSSAAGIQGALNIKSATGNVYLRLTNNQIKADKATAGNDAAFILTPA